MGLDTQEEPDLGFSSSLVRPLLVRTANDDSVVLAQAEERYRRLEERFHALEEATGQLTWVTDAQGGVEDIPSWRAFTGATVSEVCGLGWLQTLHPADRAPTLAAWSAALHDKAPYQAEYRVLRRDGVYRWFIARGMPVYNDDGDIREWVGASTDITERRALQDRTLAVLNALLEMAQTLVQVPYDGDAETARPPGNPASLNLAELTRHVLHCDRVGLSAIDPQTQIPYPLAVAGLGPDETARWWQEQTAQTTPMDHSTPEYRDLAVGKVLLIDLTQPPYDHLPNPYGIRVMLVAPLRIGERLIGLLTLDYGGADHDYTDEELRLVGALAQLTALIVEHERLLRAREEAETRALALEKANAQMDGFLHMVNHELKTPLTALRAYIDIAEQRMRRQLGKGDAPQQRAIEGLHLVLSSAKEQGQRLTRLLGDLLAASSINADHLEMQLALCDLVPLVRGIVQQQRQVTPERQIVLRAPVRRGTLMVQGDALRLGQVLTNYLNNAINYAPTDQPIVVSLHAEGHQVRVAVTDHGPGLAHAEQARIWERFERGAEARHMGGGLGLGLYISQAIITQHGGQVGVQSEPGQGATFWFTLPRVLGASA